jgi:hypothetical protein
MQLRALTSLRPFRAHDTKYLREQESPRKQNSDKIKIQNLCPKIFLQYLKKNCGIIEQIYVNVL